MAGVNQFPKVTMRNLLLLLSTTGLATILAACADDRDLNPPMDGFNVEASDARAIEIADAVMRAMGGRESWDSTRYLSWSFFNGDDQVWDKWTGRFRWQRDSIVVLMNVATMEGDAWVSDALVTDEQAREELLRSGHRNWINSSYWLLMPFKLKDSGVTLRHIGEGPMEDGRTAEILSLTFQGVGITPQNRYEVFVDKESMLVGQWSYYADSSDAEPGFTLPWSNWEQHGAILLSADRGTRSDGSVFALENVGVYPDLPESIFSRPERVDLALLGADDQVPGDPGGPGQPRAE